MYVLSLKSNVKNFKIQPTTFYIFQNNKCFKKLRIIVLLYCRTCQKAIIVIIVFSSINLNKISTENLIAEYLVANKNCFLNCNSEVFVY